MDVWMRRGVALLVAGVASVPAMAGVASAATTITVNSQADTPLPAPGTQTACPATCSLREAVQVADSNPWSRQHDHPARRDPRADHGGDHGRRPRQR